MPVIIATDILVYLVFVISAILVYLALKGKGTANIVYLHVRKKPLAVACLFILALYGAVALSDSLRWRDKLPTPEAEATVQAEAKTLAGAIVHYSPEALTLLDRVLSGLREDTEKTFSAPMAKTLYVKETIEEPEGTSKRGYAPLKHPGKHLLGTDKVGGDVLYAAIKGIRTGVVIGVGTTALAIPFAILFGVLAGYFGGVIDDIIQYIYTTLSSIPDILLIVAFMLIFGTRGYQGGSITDADLSFVIFVLNDRLFWLCFIMGITSWTGLCRLVRAETLKLRELEYVEAAEAFAVGRLTIIIRHIVPNLMHLALITLVLQFSGLVLAEAILSYLGIGVGSEMGSWGNMINMARLELSREPVVWWSLLGAFAFMFALVLPANIFGDAVRDALDPRLRSK